MLTQVRPRRARLNPHHPLTPYCRLFLTLDSGQQAYDLSESRIELEDYGSAPATTGGISGTAVTFSGNRGMWAGGDGFDFTTRWGVGHPLTLTSAQGILLYARMRIDQRTNWSSSYPRILELSDNAGGWPGRGWVWEVDHELNSNGSITILVDNNPPRYLRWDPPGVFDNQLHDYVFHFLGGGGASINLNPPYGVFVDGEHSVHNHANSSMSFLYSNQTNIGLRLGNRPNQQRPFAGDIEMIAVFSAEDREFTFNEVVAFARNPLEILAPFDVTPWLSAVPSVPALYQAHRQFLIP